MGTRGDFYVGRGEDAEWIGSIAFDAYQSGFERDGLFTCTTEEEWRKAVAEELASRDDATLPEQGWPWPWDDSNTTDYSYAFDDGKVWGTAFGHGWWDATQPEPEEDGWQAKTCVFPDMSEQKNTAQLGSKRSGIMVVTAPGVLEQD